MDWRNGGEIVNVNVDNYFNPAGFQSVSGDAEVKSESRP